MGDTEENSTEAGNHRIQEEAGEIDRLLSADAGGETPRPSSLPFPQGSLMWGAENGRFAPDSSQPASAHQADFGNKYNAISAHCWVGRDGRRRRPTEELLPLRRTDARRWRRIDSRTRAARNGAMRGRLRVCAPIRSGRPGSRRGRRNSRVRTGSAKNHRPSKWSARSDSDESSKLKSRMVGSGRRTADILSREIRMGMV